ncbi:class I SAM-dependent RNA methyltransferase [Candidatus Saccharibacteria bacterium]|nr:class I SAM-dependent RNA methyltransferase [Candidatus Saccharibacteria bacterium]
MSKKSTLILDNVKVDKLVHGGQGIAEAQDGRKIFLWGGLPGEIVNVRVTKKKRSYFEGIVTDVISRSTDRIEPVEPEVYLSSSPWQIMSLNAENNAKQAILEETFSREGVDIYKWGNFSFAGNEYGYRNKVELGFWGDDRGVHYASYVRGTHGKQIITRNALANESINSVLDDFLKSLNTFIYKNKYRAGDFKTVIIRSNKKGEVVAALFTKLDADFSQFIKPANLKGLIICYSNPKSPASVRTKDLYINGDITLTDTLMGTNITYDVFSFFQVNLPIFEQVLGRIDYFSGGIPKIDMYSGVGAIGIPIGMTDILVESDENNVKMAKMNASNLPIKVVHATSESALEYIDDKHCVIVDPPRVGLHKDLANKLLEVLPPQIAYLSCNPSTQARDVALLQDRYKIRAIEGYNFFPRTPHIESLVVLEKK